MMQPQGDITPAPPAGAAAAHIWTPPPRAVVPSAWLLVLQRAEVAPPLEHTTPRRVPTRVRFPWER